MNLLFPGTNYIPTGFKYWLFSGSSQFSVGQAGTSVHSSGQYWAEFQLFNAN